MKEQLSSQNGYDHAALNAMLRGELAAVESYNLGLKQSLSPAVRAELERIRDEHQEAVCALRQWVRDFREKPSSSSGAWGMFAAMVNGAASVAGESLLLEALKRGERLGEATYRAALGNPDHRDAFRFLVGSKLLPQCQEHLATLARLFSADRSTHVN